MAEDSTTRKITLREFKPESYKVWEMSTKATLKYNKLFNIVDGTDTDPTPRDDDGTILRPIPAATKVLVEKWQHDHERAREAIIRCLPDSELLKLDDVQDDVTAIWKQLHDEYGRPSNLEYVRASNDLTNLKKDEKATINDHINKFEQLVHEVNYNKPSDTKNMEESVVNLKFLNTLIVDQASSDKNGRHSSMPRALNSRPCRHNNSMRKSESTLEGANLSNQYPTKLKPSIPSFSNLSKLSPLDLTITNETMMTVAATAQEDEEATMATLATMAMTMTIVIVAKAKTTQVGGDIPTTRISPVSYMEGDTVQKSALYSRDRLANSSRHLAEISIINNETRTATTSQISTASKPPKSHACSSTKSRLLLQLLIHPLK